MKGMSNPNPAIFGISTRDFHVKIPIFTSQVSAGFPSVAEDHFDQKIDLQALLVTHPAATFLVRAIGESMREAGILPGDLLVVDRSLTAQSGDIVVACSDGEFLVKRLRQRHTHWYLFAENSQFTFSPLLVGENTQIWGVVRGIVRNLKGG